MFEFFFRFVESLEQYQEYVGAFEEFFADLPHKIGDMFSETIAKKVFPR